jgi:hypothetical protein
MTMIVVPAPAKDADILKVVETWIDLLAARQYKEAAGLLMHDAANQNWTPALLAEVLDGYQKLEGRGPVTPVAGAETKGYEPYRDVDFWEDEKGSFAGDLHYSLPLGGVWSDVTALFNIRRVKGGYALELDDIHVL